jgi:hypothetical protein
MSFLNTLASGSAAYGRFRADTSIVFFSSFAVVGCIIAIWLVLQPDNKKVTQGKVKTVDCVDGPGSSQSRYMCNTQVEFVTDERKTIIGSMQQGLDFKPAINSDITISYDPNQPTRISTFTLSTRLMGIVSMILIVVLLSCLIFQRQLVNSNSTYASIYGAGSAVGDVMSFFRR